MEELLTPVSRTYRKDNNGIDLLSVSQPAKPAAIPKPPFRGSSPDEALETLKSQPDYETLSSVLRYLWQGSKGKQSFNILKPSPQSAQIVQVLVTEIVPNYWTVLKEDSSSQKKPQHLDVLLGCLLSVTGLNAALTFLRALLQEAKKEPGGLKQSHAVFNIGFIIDLLSQLLQPDDQARKIWLGTSSSEDNIGKVRALRQEFVSLLAGGKIISLSAEAEDLLQQAEKLQDPYWVADSKQYVQWLGHSLVHWIKSGCGEDEVKLCADVVARALRLGHSGQSPSIFAISSTDI
jgi:telomere length regulation protein